MKDVDLLLLPKDLMPALNLGCQAPAFFERFPLSTRRNILCWIASAKTQTTRIKRIEITASEAAQGERMKSHG